MLLLVATEQNTGPQAVLRRLQRARVLKPNARADGNGGARPAGSGNTTRIVYLPSLLLRRVYPTPFLTPQFRQSLACHGRPTHGRATQSRRHVEAVDFEAQLNANDANAVEGVDSAADAEYETNPECIAAVPTGTVDISPLSVYGVIPDENGGRDIPPQS